MTKLPIELFNLQKYKPPYAVGEIIQAVECPNCNQQNEQFKSKCFACGARLIEITEIEPPLPQEPTQDPVGAIWVFFAAIVIGVGLLIQLAIWAQ